MLSTLYKSGRRWVDASSPDAENRVMPGDVERELGPADSSSAARHSGSTCSSRGSSGLPGSSTSCAPSARRGTARGCGSSSSSRACRWRAPRCPERLGFTRAADRAWCGAAAVRLPAPRATRLLIRAASAADVPRLRRRREGPLQRLRRTRPGPRPRRRVLRLPQRRRAECAVLELPRSRHGLTHSLSSGKSRSLYSPATAASGSACLSPSEARSSTRRILPEIVLGSSANSSRRMRL